VATRTSDWNTAVINEFRANEGKVGGYWRGRSLLLLHHRGAHSGIERINPLAYRREGDTLYIFGSKGGSPNHPDWYYNLKANPRASVEVGTETYEVEARITDPAERDEIYARQAEEYPAFGEYEKHTKRKIPVVALKRIA